MTNVLEHNNNNLFMNDIVPEVGDVTGRLDSDGVTGSVTLTRCVPDAQLSLPCDNLQCKTIKIEIEEAVY